MNAIYARQSVDRSDSISIESQVEFCKYELRGEEYKVYSDKGYSGKNTERPAFAEMISDIKNGNISKVIVYKLDRISRSILDFSNIMEYFEKFKVEFVSTTEKFDTSSPMGRAMLNICIVFAQLERETIQMRVADAYFSRCQKGLYMGGRIPYGFRLGPATVNGVKTSKYITEPGEAAQIKLIYELYARPECSYGDIIRYFQENGILKNGKPWERTRLAEILKNPVYVRADLSIYEFYRDQGVTLINPPEDYIGINGCYYYKGQKTSGRKDKEPDGDHLVLAPHEGIVSSALWLKCRAKNQEIPQIKPFQKAKNTWLAGKIKCGVCGYALIEKHSSTMRSGYFYCSHKMNSKACAGPGTIYSDEVEQLIGHEIRNKLAQFVVLRKRKDDKSKAKASAINIELTQVKNEINSLTERMAEADDIMFHYISERIQELDKKKQILQEKNSEMIKKEKGDYIEIRTHSTMWNQLSFEDKRQVVDQLIRVIYATSDLIRIEWRI